MIGQTRCSLSAAVLIAAGTVLYAADANRAIADAESRRRGAEDSLREIVAKTDPQIDQTLASYAAAQKNQNAWLDLVCQAVEQGAATAPDVTAASEAATAALMDWVTVGGRALRLKPLSASMTEGLRKVVAHDLAEIASVSWTNYRAADPSTREQASTSLKTRLRWKTVEEIQSTN